MSGVIRVARAALGLALLGVSWPCDCLRAAEPTGRVAFNRDIRPILSENCLACHGPDARHREAGLRLDSEESVRAALASGNHAVVGGQPEESELIFRVETDDPTLLMPPPKTGKALTREQVALMRRWVEEGAPWEAHWSLAPIGRPAVPAVGEPGSVRNPIDAFVRSAQVERGLAPSAEADRVTLIRRLAFDLTGLPPAPDEVDAFVADERPDAYERLVERYLASPRYGERMALLWLDLVRYADSVGYHGDQPVSVSPYRDYVIRAFNANLPFDQFTREQIAGDLLPDATRDQQVAAGYNRLGMMSAEGGVQPKEYLAKYAAERVRTLSGAWLGVTLGCAECHDHKYDPFTTRDFYRLQAFFADIEERGLYDTGNFGPTLPVPTPEQETADTLLAHQIAELKAVLERSTPELEAAQAQWERTEHPSVAWTTLAPTVVESAGKATTTVLPDGSVLVTGEAPERDTTRVVAPLPVGGMTALRIELLPDDSLPVRGPGRASNGNVVLTEVTLAVQRAEGTTPQPLVLEHATASFEQNLLAEQNPYKSWTAASAIDGDARGAGLGWAILGEAGLANEAVFETAIDVGAAPGAIVTITLAQNHENPRHTLGRFRLSVTNQARPVKARGVGLPRGAREVLATSPELRTPEQKAALSAFYRTIAPLLDPQRKELAAREAERKALGDSTTTMLATRRVAPRPIRVLPRGNWMDDSGEEVEPGVPGVLPQPAGGSRRLTRLELANWLVAPENPLTARNLVNHLWRRSFGAGLSRKLDDLGSQGEWPSHPELMDWLAGRLIDTGWDVKGLVRLIVTSATYRQASRPRSDLAEADPFNRWLARQSRFRLDAELVRDNALAMSGLLVERLGGRSVKPYQPPGYWSFLNFPKREWENDTGAAVYRRGLYVHWQRQYLYPSLMAFDAPSREECTADRRQSNTPLQALVLLNDPVYVEAARALAARIVREGGATDAERLRWAFRRARSREPAPVETEPLVGMLAQQRAAYRADEAAARALLGVGSAPVPDGVDPAELAAWTNVARTLLNLAATQTRY